MIEFTTVVGLDTSHLSEWKQSWPTWVRFRPQILAHPLLLICDGDRSLSEWQNDLAFVHHPDLKVVPWQLEGVSQHEKLLTGLTLVSPTYLTTPWYLKLDTGAVAMRDGEWLRKEWFDPDPSGQLPAFVASPWGYTKPADMIERLDNWGDLVPALQAFPRLNLRPTAGSSRVRHPRINSWCFFGNTRWTREVTAWCGGRLPVPSHDTFLWYCAARRGTPFRKVRMRPFGWQHLSRRRALLTACANAMKEAPPITDSSPVPPDGPLPTARRIRPRHAVRLIELFRQRPETMLRGAEIGVYRGEMSRALLTYLPHLFLHMVDPWKLVPPDHPYYLSGDRVARNTAAQFFEARQQAEEGTAFASNRREILPIESLEAAPRIPDASLDFAFIDAEHTYDAVRADMQAWWPKIRPGGIFSGHDYGGLRDRRGKWGVRRAVDEFAGQLGYQVCLDNGSTVWWILKPQS